MNAKSPSKEGLSKHRLSQKQKTEFEETGLLTVENAISDEVVHALTQVVDKIYDENTEEGKFFFRPNCVVEDPLFIELMQCPTTFPLVWDLLGWNIYLYHSHFIVSPPIPEGKREPRKTLGWHQDSGRVNWDIETTPKPRISLKVAFWLTDTTTPDCGAMHAVPGAHRQDNLEIPRDGVSNPKGMVALTAKSGTTTFFDRRLWHAASPNWSSITRKVVFMGYGYRWIRSKDYDIQPRELLDKLDPIQRQLLGDGPSANGHFSPRTEEDVPLYNLIKQIRGEKSMGPLPWGAGPFINKGASE